MKRLLAASLIALSPAAFAAGAGGYVDAFYVPKADIDLDGGSDDGDGFGVRGQVNLAPQFALTGEYRTVSYDDSDTDFDQFRIGGMFLAQGQSGFGAEYINGSLDETDVSGFGIHGRLAGDVAPQLQLYGQLGYLMTTFEDTGFEDDFTGLEFSVGGVFNVNKQFGILLDWRRTDLSGDDSDIDATFTDIALGARINL